MKNENYTITINNKETNLQIKLLINKDYDLKVRDLLELSESIANQQNKSSGQMMELEIFSKASNRIVSQEQSICEILKNINMDEFEIFNRYSKQYSELQAIYVRINFVYNNKRIVERSFQFSRFDKLSQIGEEILKYLKKTKEECELQFIIKGKVYQPFKVNFTLADIHFIDNDEIQIIIPMKLNVQLQDGSTVSNMQFLLNQNDTFMNIENKIHESLQLYKENAKLLFEVDNRIQNETTYNKSLSELNISDSTKISVKIRYSGGFQRKENLY